MRRRLVLFGLAAAFVVVLSVLALGDRLLVDWLWFGVLGYRRVFVTALGAGVAIFLAVWVLSFAFFLVNGLIALWLSPERERLRVVRRADGAAEVDLPELLRALGARVPWRLLTAVASAALAFFLAQGEASSWTTYLKGWYGVPFHRADPAFGRDIGFYLFRLPLLEELRDLWLMMLFFAALTSGLIYWARGAIDLRVSPPEVSPAAVGHLSVLLALFFLQRAFSYWLARFGLLLHTNGVVFGLRYVDHLLWEPGLWLLVVLGLLACAISLANVGRGGFRLPLWAAAVLFVPAIALNFLQPVIESVWVKPDELRKERPYLTRNIEMTRQAYRIDTVDVKPFAGRGRLTRASLSQDAATVANIRLWDPRPLLATYRQLQEIRLYYDFRQVDIDRYWIDGRYTQVMLSARELNVSLLPENAQTWVNRHLKFTHGTGLVMSPVNAKDTEGLPVFFLKDIPPSSGVGLKVNTPAIYFGLQPDNYVVVKAATSEFDYPLGSNNVYSFYQGKGGVPVSGLWRRLLFGFFYRDLNLLVTDNIVAGSRIMLRRNITQRLARLAPFLVQDQRPYLVLADGRLVWLVDCYTTSAHYPYSQRNPDGINYIRNSVKAAVDAYDGTVTFYVADPHDPVIETWERIFPQMFRPLAAMPAALRQHIRYPEDLFLVQADIYRVYHMTDPVVFYNREDLWGFPRENYAGETVVMRPYYVIMRLPGESQAEYILMLPMVPQSRDTVRDNMISWLAARCDGADYGHLLEYAFSKDRLFYGPYQIQARINQNPEISQQYSLWNQMGSKVILGNLLVIPVEDSLLYVEPLYIRAENGQLPELERVIASYNDRIVMADDLDHALAALFATPTPSGATVAQTAKAQLRPGAAAPASGSAVGVAEARRLYAAALTALRAGDWTRFGSEMEKLGEALAGGHETASH